MTVLLANALFVIHLSSVAPRSQQPLSLGHGALRMLSVGPTLSAEVRPRHLEPPVQQVAAGQECRFAMFDRPPKISENPIPAEISLDDVALKTTVRDLSRIVAVLKNYDSTDKVPFAIKYEVRVPEEVSGGLVFEDAAQYLVVSLPEIGSTKFPTISKGTAVRFKRLLDAGPLKFDGCSGVKSGITWLSRQ
jgi:hypothetical protein